MKMFNYKMKEEEKKTIKMPSTKAKSSMKKKTNRMPKKQEQTFQKNRKKATAKIWHKNVFSIFK